MMRINAMYCLDNPVSCFFFRQFVALFKSFLHKGTPGTISRTVYGLLELFECRTGAGFKQTSVCDKQTFAKKA